MPENTPSPDTLTMRANIIERRLPAVPAAVHLKGVDGDLHDPEKTFDAVELIWDTRAHCTVQL